MKIDDIPQSNIESKNEQRWFSLIKHKATELRYGEITIKLTVKNGKIVTAKNMVLEKNYIIALDN